VTGGLREEEGTFLMEGYLREFIEYEKILMGYATK